MATTKQMQKVVEEVSKVYQFAFGEKKTASLQFQTGESPSYDLLLPCPEYLKGTNDCEGSNFTGGHFHADSFEQLQTFADWMKGIQLLKVVPVKFTRKGRPRKIQDLAA